MNTRWNEILGSALHISNFFVAPIVFIVFGPVLVAQQYCLSGTVTSVPVCNGCSFNVGDPVALTFTVQPGSVSCSNTLVGKNCMANAVFSANIGSRYWTSDNATTSTVGFTVFGNGSNYTDISLNGVSPLSPVPSPGTPGEKLSATVQFPVYPGNLLPNNTFPASLPSPADLAAANLPSVDSSATSSPDGANPHFSYTGQSCAMSPSTAPPTINPGGVVPIYSSSTTVESGEWVSIYGTNLATLPATWTGNFPTTLGGTSVTINGKPAYLWIVSPGQINLQVPDDTATGPVPVVVTTPNGSATSTVTLGQFAPTFLFLDAKHVTGIILRSNGSGAFGGGTYDIIGPTGNSLGYPTVAAKAGDSIVLFGTGFGPTNPQVPAGQAYSGAAASTSPVTLLVNNVSVKPSFAGLSGAGLYQINLTVPQGLGTGDVALQATVGGVQTPLGVVLSLQ